MGERAAASLGEPDHRGLARDRLRGTLRSLDRLSEVAGAILLAREDILAVEQHRVITEPGELGCVAVIEAGTRVAGEDHDDRAFAGGGSVGGLGRTVRPRRGGDTSRPACARHEERERPPDETRSTLAITLP